MEWFIYTGKVKGVSEVQRVGYVRTPNEIVVRISDDGFIVITTIGQIPREDIPAMVEMLKRTPLKEVVPLPPLVMVEVSGKLESVLVGEVPEACEHCGELTDPQLNGFCSDRCATCTSYSAHEGQECIGACEVKK